MGRLVGLDRRHTPAGVEPLWRELTGRQLRRHRRHRRETLAQVAARAGVSTQYLSELERGVKDPSSEILAAVAGAVGLSLLDLTRVVAQDLLGARTDLASRQVTRSCGGGPVGGSSGARGPVALAA